MRNLLIALSAALLTALGPMAANARQDAGKPATQQSGYELVVFEADGCNFCISFRSDVLPLYTTSRIGRQTPIRFVNVSKADESGMGLSSAITVAPTVVVMHQGQEIDRIVGYTGPINFMNSIAHILGRGE